MSKLFFDALIIGQGLAGTVLFHLLDHAGYKVLVVDNKHHTSASQAAAGIYNPIIIKRIRESWRGLEFIEYARDFYQFLEAKYSWQMLKDLPINRIFVSEKEYCAWEDKLLEDQWEQRIKISKKEILGHVQNVGVVKHTGWLNIPAFLEKTKDSLKEKGLLLEEQFDFDNLHHSGEIVQYKGVSANRIFFCEGYKVSLNPFFSYLPLSPVKGEILVIEDPDLKFEEILHCGHFILPIGNNQYKIGATFSWDDLNEEPTSRARRDLLNGISKYTSDQLKIIDHKAGVRPAVSDRRPLIGTHKTEKNYHIFNGLGTRGVMLAPLLGKNLIDHIYSDISLVPQASIERFN